MYGMNGKLLVVDLEAKTAEVRTVRETTLQKYRGIEALADKFLKGDTLEVLSPLVQDGTLEVEYIENTEGEMQDSAPHPQQHIYINCALPLKKGDILRKSLKDKGGEA